MTVFDTDVLTEILRGVPRFVQRAMLIPPKDQAIPIVGAEEILRGRLNAIRQAEAGKLRITIARAYELMRESLSDFRKVTIPPYTDRAEMLFQEWRAQKVRIATHDLRIAALCVDHNAKLASRNRRDFDRVPRLSVEYWS
jgi:tRNA(fMet)-specific endonuclease VapC